jgi:hypothetical protein
LKGDNVDPFLGEGRCLFQNRGVVLKLVNGDSHFIQIINCLVDPEMSDEVAVPEEADE